MVKHIEYGVMATTLAGHRYLDQTFLTKGAAEDVIKMRTEYYRNDETYKIVQREVEVILGQWKPIDEAPAHEHKCASEGYLDHEPSAHCICCICGKRFDGRAEVSAT